ncbi:MAG: PKD domain-containing protein [Nanoarchaeota archaeon]|nr:PKD domain-containing protein [Nanoarchaeota archaeon]
MKNVFMSILLVFLLIGSALGNVDFAKAEDIEDVTLSVPTYEPERMVLGIDGLESVDVTVTITNIGDPLNLNIEAGIPLSSEGNPLNIENIENMGDLDNFEGSQNSIFRVTPTDNTIAGIYRGNIIVTDGNDNSEETTYEIDVIENEAPIVTISGQSSITITKGETVEFEGSVTDETGEIVSYEWKIEDNEGNVEDTHNNLGGFSYMFDEVDAYRVTLTATDEGGLEGYAGKTINVLEESLILRLYDGENELEEDDKIGLAGPENSDTKKTYSLKNQGNTNLENIQITFSGEFTDDSDEDDVKRIKLYLNGNEIILDRSYPLNDILRNGETNFEIKANIPENIKVKNYKGKIEITGESTVSDEMITYTNEKFKVVVEPKTCEDGVVGRIRISEIDIEDKNLKIGETIVGDVTVDNNDNEELSITVEVMLFNVDKNEEIIDWIEIGTEDISESEDESFNFELNIPMDNEDMDSDHTYILYFKAYEDGEEDNHCNYDSEEIDIDRKKDHVTVSRFTVNPVIASPGDFISFNVEVENIGTDEQKDVYIKITDLNNELNLELKSTLFNLKKYNKDDRDMIKTFTFTVPTDAEAKDYTLKAIVYFDREKETSEAIGKLTIQGESTTTEDTTITADTTVTATDTTGAGTYQQTGGSVLDNLGSTKTLFIIGDIVLVILAVLFLILIFKKR